MANVAGKLTGVGVGLIIMMMLITPQFAAADLDTIVDLRRTDRIIEDVDPVPSEYRICHPYGGVKMSLYKNGKLAVLVCNDDRDHTKDKPEPECKSGISGAKPFPNCKEESITLLGRWSDLVQCASQAASSCGTGNDVQNTIYFAATHNEEGSCTFICVGGSSHQFEFPPIDDGPSCTGEDRHICCTLNPSWNNCECPDPDDIGPPPPWCQYDL